AGPVPGRALARRAPPPQGRGGGRRAMTAGPPHSASVHIAADPERVFDYFTKPAAILRWMGDYAVLDPHPGGQFTLDINGVPVRGRYLAVDRPHRLGVRRAPPPPPGCHRELPRWRSPSHPTMAAPR